MLIVDVLLDGTFAERYHEAVLTRLGEGLGASGSLQPAARERTLEVVRRYAQRVKAEEADASAITTSVMRRADDGDAFRARFEDITGVELRILSGEEEARYSFLGATYGVRVNERVAVIDIGGGSTEIAIGRDAVESAVSVEIGAVRLTEMFPALAGRDTVEAVRTAAAAADALVAETFAEKFGHLPAATAMAVAGTPRTIGRIAWAEDASEVEGRSLDIGAAAMVRERLVSTAYAERRRIRGMTPERADILLAGAIIYANALSALSLSAAKITKNDLLLGLLVNQKLP